MKTVSGEGIVMEESKNTNPWNVTHMEEFLFYCCPECDHKAKDCQIFVEHAIFEHEMARETLCTVKEEDEPEMEANPEVEQEIIKMEMPSVSSKPIKAKSSKKEIIGDWQCYVCGVLKPTKSDIAGHIRQSDQMWLFLANFWLFLGSNGDNVLAILTYSGFFNYL